nr:MAG TPA: hypothetical protein [Caudoviricetes sp.]
MSNLPPKFLLAVLYIVSFKKSNLVGLALTTSTLPDPLKDFLAIANQYGSIVSYSIILSL